MSEWLPLSAGSLLIPITIKVHKSLLLSSSVTIGSKITILWLPNFTVLRLRFPCLTFIQNLVNVVRQRKVGDDGAVIV